MLPFDRSLWIEEEDSVVLETGKASSPSREDLDIAVILLPHLANFTDFEILKHDAGVHLRYIRWVSEFGHPDLVILPGTKTTLPDLLYLEESGLKEKILEYVQSGGRLLGICGGYQMLGQGLADPKGLESAQAQRQGFGFFKMDTTFQEEKVLRRSQEWLRLTLFGVSVQGEMDGAYEIHMGQTVHHQPYPPFGPQGAVHPSGRIFGTYLHGLFHSDEFRSSFLSALALDAQKRRAERSPVLSSRKLKELHYDRLKGLLERHLRLDWLRELIGTPSPATPSGRCRVR
jgi:adenosylcobyric acid synthase